MAKTYDIDEVQALLAKGIYTVRFISAQDASDRVVNCTRDWDWLNNEDISDEIGWVAPKGGNTHNFAIKAWDVDKKKWCSFYANLVKFIEFYAPTKDEDIVEE